MKGTRSRFGEVCGAIVLLALAATGVAAAHEPARRAEALLAELLRSHDSYERWFALRALRGLHWPGLVPAVRTLAESPDLYEQSLALAFLAANLDEPGPFLRALRSPHRPVRLRALRKLAAMDAPEAAAALRAVLRDDPDPELRAHAARGLARHGDEPSRVALRGALRQDDSPLVREECARALATLGDSDLPILLAEQARAARGRGRIAVARRIRIAGQRRLTPLLVPWLDDGDPEVRAAAAAAILALAAAHPPAAEAR